MGPLGEKAITTPGVRKLGPPDTPVSTAAEVMEFLQKTISGWPSDLPEPEPYDAVHVIGDIRGPLPGLVEPPLAPLQDLGVAVVSLLHEAFSSVHFTPTARIALLDMLELLCAVGSGGSTCRMSACGMRTSIEQNWEQLARETVVDKNSMGEPMTPFVAHYLDWTRVEQEHQWCGVPWPNYAQQGWTWCRGRTPYSRGYTCGLWLLFHSLIASAASVPAEASTAWRRLQALSSSPLEIIRSYVREFFACTECREHFLSVALLPEDLSTPKAQALWMWRAHNMATKHVNEDEGTVTKWALPPRELWPSLEQCPACRLPDGTTFRTEQVFQHLVQFYGGVVV